MKAVFWTREETATRIESDWRETNLAQALQNGAHAQGDEVEIRIAQSAYEPDVVDCDLVCMAGVKSRHWFTAYARAGIPWLYFDKGYIRERASDQWLKFWRMSVNSHHPIDFLTHARKNDKRAASMGKAFKFEPWREYRGPAILLDGGSEKNFKFNGIVPESATIEDIDEHCRWLVRRIEQIAPGHPVIYRPKQSSKGRHGIEGTQFSYKKGANFKDPTADLEQAHVVVTYNGAISYDANKMGIPSIVLGSGPGRPISSTRLADIWVPRMATTEERQQWFNNLAWCQFTPSEISAGVAWEIAKEMLEVTPTRTPAEACPCTPL